MEDQAGIAAGQEPGGDPSQVDTQDDKNKPEGQEPEVFDAEYVKKLRSEAASYRTRMSNAERELKSIKENGLSEAEKLQKERDALRAERDQLAAEIRLVRVQTAATKAGALYPDAVAKLVPADEEDLDAAIKEARKQYPALFRASTIDGGQGNGQSVQTGSDMNAMIRRAAGRN